MSFAKTNAHQAVVEEEHLRLLRIGWLISAGANVMWVLFPLIYVAMGIFVVAAPFPEGQGTKDPPPAMFGWLFVGLGLGASLVAAAFTTAKFLVARAIGQRKSRTLIMVVAAISCFGIPWGTALGVLTLLVMSRPSITARFNGQAIAA